MTDRETPSVPVFCADIGGSFIKFGISETPGEMRVVDRVATPARDWDAFAAALSGLIAAHGGGPADAASPMASAVAPPLALSIAGLTDPRDGTALAANIPCITGRKLGTELSAVLKRPVVAANDADCLTLAEAHDGAGRGHPIVFCAIIGTGIGGGLAIDGRLVRGAGGVTGEWGHGPIVNTTVRLGEETIHVPRLDCGCGQSGCADTVGGARGIERLHHFLHGQDATSHTILDAWRRNDAEAGKTIALWLELIADPLALTLNITGASIVPVGGGLASVPRLMALLDEAVRRRILNRFDRPLVVPAVHQEEGGLVGAAVLGHQKVFDDAV